MTTNTDLSVLTFYKHTMDELFSIIISFEKLLDIGFIEFDNLNRYGHFLLHENFYLSILLESISEFLSKFEFENDELYDEISELTDEYFLLHDADPNDLFDKINEEIGDAELEHLVNTNVRLIDMILDYVDLFLLEEEITNDLSLFINYDYIDYFNQRFNNIDIFDRFDGIYLN